MKEKPGAVRSLPRVPRGSAVRDDSLDAPVTLLIASEVLFTAWGTHAPPASQIIAVIDGDLSGAVDAIRLKHPVRSSSSRCLPQVAEERR